MKPKRFMVIAGEASGDLLASELVRAIRRELAESADVPTSDYQPLVTSLEPRFFGAGGPHLAAAGVDLAFDLTVHSVTGLSDVLKNYFKFRQLFKRLYDLALEREPDGIICVDFSGFNRRLAHAIKQHVRGRSGWFHDWQPRIVQYISPQVWASREGRVFQIARDYDLVLSIFPFEQAWYARRVPKLRVDFVGHPMLDRYGQPESGEPARADGGDPAVVLLPGSRAGELSRHLPVILGALALMRAELPALRAAMVLPNERLALQARELGLPGDTRIQIGDLPGALRGADLAIASTGTVTMECAYFGVPTVALYKTSWPNYEIGKRIIRVKHLAMPNLLAGEEIVPEFIQGAATAGHLAEAALRLLKDGPRRQAIRQRFAEIISKLGGPGANRRAAQAIVRLVERAGPVRAALPG